MKLRNKKTGEIIKFDAILPVKDVVGDSVAHLEYGSLAELNEEWEDAPEEPKSFWTINTTFDCAEPIVSVIEISERYYDDKDAKSIGNYFETKEEAEKAVEKLKAFKRLRDKGFRFDPVDRYEALCGNGFNIPITATMPPEAYTDTEVSKDLDLLFGGEE